jgi:hypothetical protein
MHECEGWEDSEGTSRERRFFFPEPMFYCKLSFKCRMKL